MEPDLLDARQRDFLRIVRSTLANFAREHALELSDSVEIDFPSASLDGDGRPRFVMTLPASLIVSDLGAALVFYHDVVGRGFEFPMRRFLDLHLRSDDVFIDVGAHWGVHALTAATLRPGQVSVVAIEAHPGNAAILARWIARNRLEGDVEAIPKAVGDRDGELRMWVSISSMAHHLRGTASEPSMNAIDVAMTTLDRILVDRPQLRWRRFILKIDVEGNEPDVLHGAQNLFATEDVAAVLWEKSAFYEPSLQEQRDATIVDFLASRGFEHFRMESESAGGRLIRVDPMEFRGNVFSLAHGFERKERYE
jgi:FkbM family methyltransferase